jgi:hypothetical protein
MDDIRGASAAIYIAGNDTVCPEHFRRLHMHPTDNGRLPQQFNYSFSI